MPAIKNDSNNFTLFIQPDVHCLTTKLLHFDVERFTQVRSELQLKLNLINRFIFQYRNVIFCRFFALISQGFTHFTYQDLTCSFYQPKASFNYIH